MANKTPLGSKKKPSKSPPEVTPESRLAAGRRLRAAQAAAVPTGPVFAFDPALVIARLVAGKSSREYQLDETIFSQGEPANAVFYIETGNVKLTVVSQAGKEAVVAVLCEAVSSARAAWLVNWSESPLPGR
jgi:CRP/FNR family transcriptional regulator, cyclic AMP receptor protein